MIALLSTCLLVAVAFFLVEIYQAHKSAPRRPPTGAFSHHTPVAYDPAGDWWITPGVVVFGTVVAFLYLAILAVSL